MASDGKSFLALARERKGLSQEQLAVRLDVTQATISNWEHGAVPHPRLWPKVAKEYGVSKGEIVRHFTEAKAS